MHFYRSVSLLVLCLFSIAAAAQQNLPSVELTASGIVIRGVTAKSDVFVFAIAREQNGYYTNVVPRQNTLRDDDGDGAVQWDIGRDLPGRSMWFAVDMTTGHYAVAVPAGYDATRIALTGEHLKKSLGDEIGQLAFPGTLVDFLVIRPGTGAWRSLAGLRGPEDEGSEEDRITVSTLHLEPQGNHHQPAPQKLKKGDVVLIVNSDRAQYGIARVGEDR